MPNQEQVPIHRLLGTIHSRDRSVGTHDKAVQHHCEAPVEPQPKDNCSSKCYCAPKCFSRRHKPMQLELLVQQSQPWQSGRQRRPAHVPCDQGRLLRRPTALSARTCVPCFPRPQGIQYSEQPDVLRPCCQLSDGKRNQAKQSVFYCQRHQDQQSLASRDYIARHTSSWMYHCVHHHYCQDCRQNLF